MKLMIALFLLIGLGANAQVKKHIDVQATNYSTKMCTNKATGDVYVAKSNETNDAFISLISYDANGDLRFAKQFEDTTGNGVYAMDLNIINDTLYLVSTEYWLYCYVSKFDLQGNYISGTAIERSTMGTYEYDRIIGNPDNSLTVLLSEYDQIRIINLNHDLSINWAKVFSTDTTGSGKNPGFALTSCNNGDIVITAKANNMLSIIRLDISGNVLWCKTFDEANIEYNHPKHVRELTNGNILISGLRMDSFFGSDASTGVILFNNQGELLWANKYLIGNLQGYARNSFELANGNMLIAGLVSYPNEGSFLMEIDNQGNVINNSVDPDYAYIESDAYLNGVIVLNQSYDSLFLDHISAQTLNTCGSYVDAITVSPMNISDSSISNSITSAVINPAVFDFSLIYESIITPFDTYVCGSQGDEVFLSNGNIQSIKYDIYPNPAFDFLQIESQSIISSYKIIDLNGRQIRHSMANSNHIKIDVHTLPRGMYFLEIQNAAGIGLEKFVVK